MNSKHTPGPWNVQWTKKEAGKVDLILVGPGSDYTTAFVPCFGDNSDQNASLIAAAPEMLEALKIADRFAREILTDGEASTAPLAVLKTIGAALKKAGL
jgi:hypothetical protein